MMGREGVQPEADVRAVMQESKQTFDFPACWPHSQGAEVQIQGKEQEVCCEMQCPGPLLHLCQTLRGKEIDF